MDKVVRLGTAKTDGGRSYSVYAHITLKSGALSITGVEGPLSSGNCLGSCGQIVASRPSIAPAPGWTRRGIAEFWATWDRWHLNDMRAGCEHQRALGWTAKDHLSEPCPTCGYRFGTKWITEEVPAYVIDYLEALPNTDKTPAWV